MAKPIRALRLPYPVIRCLIICNIPSLASDWLTKYGQQKLNRCKPHKAALKRQKSKMQLCFFLMQYRSFVNNYLIDKLQICTKVSVVNIAEHYV